MILVNQIISFLFIASLISIQQIYSENFIHNCNDPRIENHEVQFGHSYCSHTCRPYEEEHAQCSSSGNCLCHSPCYNDEPIEIKPIGNSICPPIETDPIDTNFDKVDTTCNISCPLECKGGIKGRICGESDPIVDNLTMEANIFVTICTCICPSQQCISGIPVIVVTEENSLQSTTSIPPIQQETQLIIFKPSIYVKLKKKFSSIIKILVTMFSIFVKIYLLNVLTLIGVKFLLTLIGFI